MEVYPITIDGEDAGTLRVEQRGARTVFTAECGMSPELLRISVYGGGKEGYLGVLAPEDGALVCFDGERTLIALPPGDARIPDRPPGERREIEGKEYLVYRTRNGRIET